MSSLAIRLAQTSIASTPGSLQTQHVVASVNSAFRHQHPIVGHLPAHADRMFQIDPERMEVAVIDPDQHRASMEHARQIAFFVKLDQQRQPQFDRFVVQLSQVAIVEAFGNEQRGIGAEAAGLQQLVRVQNEVFPKQRNMGAFANRPKVFQASLKKGSIGQDADAQSTDWLR